MPEAAQSSPSKPAAVLGLTFLIMGLTFALPFQLVPESQWGLLSSNFSPEVVNVYACVAWMGWAHFIFAFRGQGGALLRMPQPGRLPVYALCVAVIVCLLVLLRWAAGATLFGAVVWVYFIDHFLKAERTFDGRASVRSSLITRWLYSSHALLSFAWLSIVLFNVGNINSQPWVLLGVSVLLGAAILLFGGWRSLAAGDFRSPLLALFFVAEALVWGTFSRYGGPTFLTGVYVFHIAAGSYFHYFGSYFYANARSGRNDWLAIVVVNVLLIVLGYLVVRQSALGWLAPVLGAQWFTLWVGVHLVSSDVFPFVKAWRRA